MMNGQSPRPYAKGDGYEAVEMAYDGGELAMLVILPTAGTFATFESSLSGGKVLDILAGLEMKEVNLHFPKLKLDGHFGLKEPLKSLGMKQAFDGSADFSGISTTEPLRVANVLHKTFLELDENGTEAAAATAVIFDHKSARVDPPVVMKVDRPFITAIVDRQTKKRSSSSDASSNRSSDSSEPRATATLHRTGSEVRCRRASAVSATRSARGLNHLGVDPKHITIVVLPRRAARRRSETPPPGRDPESVPRYFARPIPLHGHADRAAPSCDAIPLHPHATRPGEPQLRGGRDLSSDHQVAHRMGTARRSGAIANAAKTTHHG